MSAAHTLAQFLVSQGVGTFGVDIHVGVEPDTPDDCVTLYDTGGLDPDTDEMDIFRPTVQVRVRSANYLSAFSRADQIRRLFIVSTPIVVGQTRFSGVVPQGDVTHLGRDNANRHFFSLDYRCTRSEMT